MRDENDKPVEIPKITTDTKPNGQKYDLPSGMKVGDD